MVNISLLPNSASALAAKKANKTPDPVPTSRIKGEVDEVFWSDRMGSGRKRSVKKRVSDVEERVSSRRNESSAGS
jgi:hypothetical protein